MTSRSGGSDLYINKNSILILILIRPIVSFSTVNVQQVPEFGALKGFSDILATQEDHWETCLEQEKRQTAKRFSGLGSGKEEKRD